jgi:predicted Fe-S protein YdhL (DUF1289 family)
MIVNYRIETSPSKFHPGTIAKIKIRQYQICASGCDREEAAHLAWQKYNAMLEQTAYCHGCHETFHNVFDEADHLVYVPPGGRLWAYDEGEWQCPVDIAKDRAEE